MGLVQNSSGGGWLLDYGICDEVSASDFMWAPQIIDDPMVSSAMLGFEVSCKEGSGSDNACSRKRNRVESCSAPGTKAFREKFRRDKLNDRLGLRLGLQFQDDVIVSGVSCLPVPLCSDHLRILFAFLLFRFMELCSILEPGRPAKADKVAILSDATRRLNKLRLEAQKLKESNEALQDTIKSLKEEKLELRDEKVRLNAEKERIVQALKATSTAPTFIPHLAAASAAFHAAYKTVPYPNYVPVCMWQWLPPAALDTSQDHVLRPPVA